MAHQPMSRPDPSEHRTSDAPDPPEPEKDDPDAGLYLARLASTLAAHGGGASSSDLALDLVLNEIVEQARLATTATGAAIALLRGAEMVCRATSGANAPDLGAPLDMRSGLSGACVRTRQVQRCDDTETDPRVDAAVSRTLEVRSVLVLPVLDGEELLGVFEIFSPRVGAFSERDEQTLQALSRRIVHSVHRAAETPVPPPQAEILSVVTNADAGVAPRSLDEIRQIALPAQPRPRDHWTDLLSAIVIALALLLGWMVGRVGWEQAKGSPPSVSAPAPKPQTVQPTPPPAPAQNQVAPQPSAKKPVARGAVPAALKTELKPSAGTEPPLEGLVVYEKGKVIFRMTPAPAATRVPDVAPGHSDEGTDAAPISLPPEVANTYLVQRVEPVYPDAARQQRLQGAVALDAVVGKDGIVREVRVISGDSQLTSAAVDAVRQWRFKPYLLNGSPVAFQTQITLNFAP